MRNSLHKLNRIGESTHPWRTPFPISMSLVKPPSYRPFALCFQYRLSISLVSLLTEEFKNAEGYQ